MVMLHWKQAMSCDKKIYDTMTKCSMLIFSFQKYLTDLIVFPQLTFFH